MLDVIDLDFEYPDKTVLRAIACHVPAGRMLHLCGRNGAGKTTLLKLLAGLMPPTRGEIRYNGMLIEKNRSEYLQNICYVGHKSGVSPVLTVREHCRFEIQCHADSAHLNTLLDTWDLFSMADVACALLSVGQRRRVALLRLLLSDARVWLLDEPLVALDNETVDLLTECMQKHLVKGGLIVLTSHQKLPQALGDAEVYCL